MHFRLRFLLAGMAILSVLHNRGSGSCQVAFGNGLLSTYVASRISFPFGSTSSLIVAKASCCFLHQTAIGMDVTTREENYTNDVGCSS